MLLVKVMLFTFYCFEFYALITRICVIFICLFFLVYFLGQWLLYVFIVFFLCSCVIGNLCLSVFFLSLLVWPCKCVSLLFFLCF